MVKTELLYAIIFFSMKIEISNQEEKKVEGK